MPMTGWYLPLTGGTIRGNVTVDAGVTIDGVDISTHDHTGVAGHGVQVAHASLSGVSADQHHAQAHAIDGADHSAAGLTAGHVLTATAATTFAFQAPAAPSIALDGLSDVTITGPVADNEVLAYDSASGLWINQTAAEAGLLTAETDPVWTAAESGYLKADGTRALSGAWDAGSFEIRAETFESDVATGTAPLTIASTTVCTNLNADLLDGNHAAAFALAGGAPTAHNLLSASHGDTTAASAVVGSLIAGQTGPVWAALAGDTSNARRFLRSLSVAGVATVPAWDALVAADYPDMVGDAGAGGTKGAVPAPGAGDAAAGKYLKASGTWATPPDTGVTDHGALTGLTPDDDHPHYLLADGTRGLSAAWDAGSWQIRAETFQSDVTTGTAPLVVASTTVVANLNADLLDGNHAAAFAVAAKGVTNGDSHDHIGGDGAAITEGAFSLSDVTTANALTTKHGLLPKLDNVATNFLNGQGAWAVPAGGTVDNGICEGRLTLSTGIPVTVADVATSTNVFWTPYKGNRIALYDGAAWTVLTFAQITMALGVVTAALPYDVFAYINAGAVAIEKLAWTNTTTRATALTQQDGVWSKSGDTTRRYLGTFYTISTSQTADSSLSLRYLWNYYNRVPRMIKAVETTNSWTYSTAAWRASNNTTVARLNFIIGYAEDTIICTTTLQCSNTTATNLVSTGIGVNSTTVNSAQISSGVYSNSSTTPSIAQWIGVPAVGLNYLQQLEYAAAATGTFYGDNGTVLVNGIVAQILM